MVRVEKVPKIILYFLIIFFVFSNQTNTLAAESKPLSVKSEAAVMLDSRTGAVLYDKNGDKELYPASLTKIATAIYAIEKGNLNDVVTVSHNAANIDGTKVYLNEGERVPLKKLIQGMLINSGNDAAIAIAEHLDGTVKQFADHLNEYLQTNVGLKHTHFVNPNGLFDKKHYTTAMDLALLTNYASKNPTFAAIFGTKKLKWDGQSWHTTLVTHHLMLNGAIPYSGITGGKTGYVDESKQTLATTADNGKMKLTVIEMKANTKKDIYDDTAKLLDYGFHSFENKLIHKSAIFKYQDQKFLTLNDTLITEPVKGSIFQVNKQGILAVKDNTGHMIQAIHLQFKPEKPVIKEHHKTSDTAGFHVNALYGFILVAVVWGLIGIRKKMKLSNKSY